jgi:hypothetical protein
MKTDNMYGYKINQNVVTRVTLYTENNRPVPKGSLLRIVAIAPKVRIIKRDKLFYDGKAYFFNAVLASQDDDYSNRIRANFCTIL